MSLQCSLASEILIVGGKTEVQKLFHELDVLFDATVWRSSNMEQIVPILVKEVRIKTFLDKLSQAFNGAVEPWSTHILMQSASSSERPNCIEVSATFNQRVNDWFRSDVDTKKRPTVVVSAFERYSSMLKNFNPLHYLLPSALPKRPDAADSCIHI
jgi:hypothetical protein